MDEIVERIERELDDVVADIFLVMMDAPCVPVGTGDGRHREVCAEIEFHGTLRGRCLLSIDAPDAAAYLSGMVGNEVEGNEQLCDDSVRELCNMIAGGWKSLQPPPPGWATMSPPSLCLRYNGSVDEDAVRVVREYRSERSGFQVELVLLAKDALTNAGRPAA